MVVKVIQFYTFWEKVSQKNILFGKSVTKTLHFFEKTQNSHNKNIYFLFVYFFNISQMRCYEIFQFI